MRPDPICLTDSPTAAGKAHLGGNIFVFIFLRLLPFTSTIQEERLGLDPRRLEAPGSFQICINYTGF